MKTTIAHDVFTFLKVYNFEYPLTLNALFKKYSSKYNLWVIYKMVFYTLVLQLYFKMGKIKKEDDTFLSKTTGGKTWGKRWEKDSFSSEVEITRNRLNRDIKKENL